MSPLPAVRKVPFGGDYNPEQRPEQVWTRDCRLFDEARIDTVTLGVFDWALIQPAEDVYGWYVAAGLDHRGVSWVMRQVPAAHAIEPRFPQVPGLETAVRVAPDGTDLLSGDRFRLGERITLAPWGVLVLTVRPAVPRSL